MSRRAAHADNDIPARCGARVFYQVADNLHAVMTRRVIAANGHERRDAELLEHTEKIFHVLLGFRRIRARRAEDGTAFEMDVFYVADGQRLDLRCVARRQMFEAVAEADDFIALIDAFNRGRRDDAVESGRGAAADQNSESAFAHVSMI